MPYQIIKNDELYHYGIKGQKWGVRRYQNPDGTLTEAGKARYGETREAFENVARSDQFYRMVKDQDVLYSQIMEKVSNDPEVVKLSNRIEKYSLNPHASIQKQNKLWDKYNAAKDNALNKYGYSEYKKKDEELLDYILSETVKSIKLNDTAEARQFVKTLLESKL